MGDFRYKDTVYFHVPIYFTYDAIQTKIMYFILQDESYNRHNIKLIGYGCPNNCIWNGGRVQFGEQYRIEHIENMIQFYKDSVGMVDLQFTFTNMLLEETDVYDRYGNALLELANKYDIEILIVSPILEKYIREKYPNIRLAKSTINKTPITDEELQKYSTIVLPRIKNKDMDYLKQIIEQKDKVQSNTVFELLVDEECPLNCPRSNKEHYRLMNESQLYIYNGMQLGCTMMHHNDTTAQKVMVFPEEINTYLDMGFNHMKLSGRDDPILFIESIVNYAIADNYQKSVKRAIYIDMINLIKTFLKPD